ncbi:MAG: hypothetical protein ACYTF9_14765 [Planctomycetota bacterium]|jgi:hypothetical protein
MPTGDDIAAEPPPIVRRERKLLLIVLTAMGAGIGLATIFVPAAGILALTMPPLVVISLFRARRWARLAAELDYRVCTHCTYQIEPAATRCAECGCDFDFAVAAEQWKSVAPRA